MEDTKFGCFCDGLSGISCVIDDPDCGCDETACDVLIELLENEKDRDSCPYWRPVTSALPFDDDSIIEQKVVEVRTKAGELTTGISLIVEAGQRCTELILELDQLREAVALLDPQPATRFVFGFRNTVTGEFRYTINDNDPNWVDATLTWEE